MVEKGLSAEEAFNPFEGVELPSYHDASDGICDVPSIVMTCRRFSSICAALSFRTEQGASLRIRRFRSL